MSENITWENPPEPPVSKARRVMALLDSRPGEWARIDGPGPTTWFPWWSQIHSDREHYEVRIERHDSNLFGRRTVYARRKPNPPRWRG